ncbi:hypothetical protein JHK85_012440 [Glycine max]|nr:hypothetical protein JHK85_012440 [Glycine max]
MVAHNSHLGSRNYNGSTLRFPPDTNWVAPEADNYVPLIRILKIEHGHKDRLQVSWLS